MKLKLVSWNCNMAFRLKAKQVLGLHPDIVIVPECESPGKLQFGPGTRKPTAIFWRGDNPHKGLGVFSYGPYSFRLMDEYQPEFKTVLPLRVSGGESDFTLFAIWAYNPADKRNCYIGQVWKAIHHYGKILENEKIILAGDFNSNTIWDKPRREGNHSDVVRYLAGKGIRSTYHQYFRREHGNERHPTLYMYRHRDKPYHIDYCFASADLLQKLEKVQVGTYKRWAPYSDHKPLVVTFGP